MPETPAFDENADARSVGVARVCRATQGALMCMALDPRWRTGSGDSIPTMVEPSQARGSAEQKSRRTGRVVKSKARSCSRHGTQAGRRAGDFARRFFACR